jgi:AhpD family alkylhydroperoxidase
MSRDDFHAFREQMNAKILASGHKGMTRFFALDTDAYRGGALAPGTKELMGLVGSLVLRCDDCVRYHLERAAEEGASREELLESLHIGLVIGGSIVIPHLRRAFSLLDELLPPVGP